MMSDTSLSRYDIAVGLPPVQSSRRRTTTGKHQNPTRFHAQTHQCTDHRRSEEHTSELQSLMRISYAVFCLKKKTQHIHKTKPTHLITHTHSTLYQHPTR